MRQSIITHPWEDTMAHTHTVDSIRFIRVARRTARGVIWSWRTDDSAYRAATAAQARRLNALAARDPSALGLSAGVHPSMRTW